LEANLRQTPSFAWRSILSSKDLIKEGLIWRIGNGRTIQIWGDKWLPTLTTYAVQSPKKLLSKNATVSTLIDSDTKWWDRPLIHSIFCKEEAETISAIPLSKYDQQEMMICRGSSIGEFTVRSVYHLEKECHEV
jgi:hypothetical protein